MSLPSAPPIRTAFVDSSAFFSLSNRNDRWHDSVRTTLAVFGRERWTLVTTNFIVAETYGLLVNRVGRHVAAAFLESIDQGPTKVIRVEMEDEIATRIILRRYEQGVFFCRRDKLRGHEASQYRRGVYAGPAFRPIRIPDARRE